MAYDAAMEFETALQARYGAIKALHIAAIAISGTLFFVRAVAVQASARWPMKKSLRLSSYGIDTILLSAGVMLIGLAPESYFSNGWLRTKLALVVLYIIVGSIALKRGKTLFIKRLALVFAVLLYSGAYQIARSHDPMAPLNALEHVFG